MAHRAEKILATIATALATDLVGVDVVRGQADAVALDADSRVHVALGADEPTGAPNIAFLDSLLTVNLTLFARAKTPLLAEQALIELRRLTHKTMRGSALVALHALVYVQDTRYGGTSEPEGEKQRDQVVVAIVTPWIVPYRMNQNDPSE